jgi:hypothetical protein
VNKDEFFRSFLSRLLPLYPQRQVKKFTKAHPKAKPSGSERCSAVLAGSESRVTVRYGGKSKARRLRRPAVPAYASPAKVILEGKGWFAQYIESNGKCNHCQLSHPGGAAHHVSGTFCNPMCPGSTIEHMEPTIGLEPMTCRLRIENDSPALRYFKDLQGLQRPFGTRFPLFGHHSIGVILS